MNKMVYLEITSCKECPFASNSLSIVPKCIKTGVHLLDINKIDIECPLADFINYNELEKLDVNIDNLGDRSCSGCTNCSCST